ncbi:TPA: AAA family ATPase [Stenotrophomonas maltophilia]|nr:AAA family ATPase [Stenotrophomonas maltophilia]
MRVEKVRLRSFKRFTDLQVGPIPVGAKLVVLVGPNGSGKSSLLEAFNHWHSLRGWGSVGDARYLRKDQSAPGEDWTRESVVVSFHGVDSTARDFRDKLYFRTAYRNEPDFNVHQLQRVESPVDNPRVDRFIANEFSVSQNYQRLVGSTLAGVYNSNNSGMLVGDLRDELAGKIKVTLNNVFDDLWFSSIGDPLNQGCFYFKKGASSEFHYKNLSAGEKSVFDLILDLVVNSSHYPDAIFFIDEPEAHIHTEKQAATLRALFGLIPGDGQLWCSTHSLGMLLEAQKIESEQPGSVAFLDFSNRDYDVEQEILPSSPDRQLWDKSLELTLGSLSSLVGPNTIYLCEGDPNSPKNKSFDAQVLERIFSASQPQSSFVSVGNADAVMDASGSAFQALRAVFPNATIRRVVDRDYRSDEEVQELKGRGICVTTERHLESYLLSDEIIGKLCLQRGSCHLTSQALRIKAEAMRESVTRMNDVDDVKSAAGEMVNGLRRLLQIRNGGSTTHTFLRDTMAPLVTADTATYQSLLADLT